MQFELSDSEEDYESETEAGDMVQQITSDNSETKAKTTPQPVLKKPGRKKTKDQSDSKVVKFKPQAQPEGEIPEVRVVEVKDGDNVKESGDVSEIETSKERERRLRRERKKRRKDKYEEVTERKDNNTDVQPSTGGIKVCQSVHECDPKNITVVVLKCHDYVRLILQSG